MMRKGLSANQPPRGRRWRHSCWACGPPARRKSKDRTSDKNVLIKEGGKWARRTSEIKSTESWKESGELC